MVLNIFPKLTVTYLIAHNVHVKEIANTKHSILLYVA